MRVTYFKNPQEKNKILGSVVKFSKTPTKLEDQVVIYFHRDKTVNA